jgi:hypothetical protein
MAELQRSGWCCDVLGLVVFRVSLVLLPMVCSWRLQRLLPGRHRSSWKWPSCSAEMHTVRVLRLFSRQLDVSR